MTRLRLWWREYRWRVQAEQRDRERIRRFIYRS